jgi:hypothetical protein
LRIKYFNHGAVIPPVNRRAEDQGAAIQHLFTQEFICIILIRAFQIGEAYPRQAVLARRHDMIGHLDQFSLGAGLFCPDQCGRNQLIGSSFRIWAADNA